MKMMKTSIFICIIILLCIIQNVFAVETLPASILEAANEIDTWKPEANSLHDSIDSITGGISLSPADPSPVNIAPAQSILPPLPPSVIATAPVTHEQSLAEVQALNSHTEHDEVLNEAARMAERDLPQVDDLLNETKDIERVHPALAVLGDKIEENNQQQQKSNENEQQQSSSQQHRRMRHRSNRSAGLTEETAAQARAHLKRHPVKSETTVHEQQHQTESHAAPIAALESSAASSSSSSVSVDADRSSRLRKMQQSFMSQSDAKCVICQFLVQQLHFHITQSVPGAKESGAGLDKNDAKKAVDKAGAPALFLEMEAEIAAEIAAESSETLDLSTETSEWLSAANTAELNSALQAEQTYFPPVPRQLNDWGTQTPKRFRQPDMLRSRPIVARYNALGDKNAVEDRENKRAVYQKLYTSVYSTFTNFCSRRFPLAYLGYCEEMLRDYRYIAQGLHYGDRPEAICMNGNFCDSYSYIRKTPHTSFTRELGDS